ncbi:MFS transporter [Actibacterium sp. 188UL27-1]|uniref:MFS transporter n=1 Tax=Actibacterium sp. 188UL27-1 TaxID=2786961 RepID=UPI00351C26DF
MAKSPLAVLAVVVSGLTSAAFRMIGVVYGREVGLTDQRIDLFLAAFVADGAIAQSPAGRLADKYDRRCVLIWFSVLGIASCAVTVGSAGVGPGLVPAAAALFGFATFPIYSIAAAHAHDFANSSERVELCVAILFFFAVGAIASPLVASALLEALGPTSPFVLTSAGHPMLVGFGLVRMLARPTRAERTRYVYAPRISFLIGRLPRKGREAKAPPKDGHP